MHIIRYYTRESGVRNLERAIAKICRKLVIRKLKNNSSELDVHEIDIKTNRQISKFVFFNINTPIKKIFLFYLSKKNHFILSVF